MFYTVADDLFIVWILLGVSRCGVHTPTNSRIVVYVCGVGGFYMCMQSRLLMCSCVWGVCVYVHACICTCVCLCACVCACLCVYDEVYSSVQAFVNTLGSYEMGHHKYYMFIDECQDCSAQM